MTISELGEVLAGLGDGVLKHHVPLEVWGALLADLLPKDHVPNPLWQLPGDGSVIVDGGRPRASPDPPRASSPKDTIPPACLPTTSADASPNRGIASPTATRLLAALIALLAYHITSRASYL